MRVNEVWVPVLGELHWVQLETKKAAEEVRTIAPSQTLEEYNCARMQADADALTESFIEVYLDANPAMARSHGHA